MAPSVNDVAEVIGDAIKDAVGPRRERIAVLEARLATQETKSVSVGVRWAGTYHTDVVYPEGALVTHASSLWMARRTTAGRPGDSRDFVLIVKRARSSDDAR